MLTRGGRQTSVWRARAGAETGTTPSQVPMRTDVGATRFHAHVTDESGIVLERSGDLNPYAAEILAEDARALRSGAQLRVTVLACPDQSALADLTRTLQRLPDLHIEMSKSRDDRIAGRWVGIERASTDRAEPPHRGRRADRRSKA